LDELVDDAKDDPKLEAALIESLQKEWPTKFGVHLRIVSLFQNREDLMYQIQF
jgi:hypothetical protein